MDVEKTIEFLLESQAKTESRLDRITDLLRTHMRTRAAQRAMDELKLRRLLDSLRNRNGG